MKRFLSPVLFVFASFVQTALAQTATPAPAQPVAPTGGANVPAATGAAQAKAPAAQPIQAKPEELAKIREKTAQIEALVRDLKTKRADPVMITDVEVYAHAGKMLLDYPDMFANQAAIERAFTTLDQGIERAKQLAAGQPQWNEGKRQKNEEEAAAEPDTLHRCSVREARESGFGSKHTNCAKRQPPFPGRR